MNKNAVENYKNGYSCSESIVKSAIDAGLAPKEILPVATAFSGGMSSGCVCGAVAGCQMVIGSMYGKNETDSNGLKAKELAKQFVDEFKKNHKATCCKVLTAGLAFGSPERKANCAIIVDDCATIVKNILELDKQRV